MISFTTDLGGRNLKALSEEIQISLSVQASWISLSGLWDLKVRSVSLSTCVSRNKTPSKGCPRS